MKESYAVLQKNVTDPGVPILDNLYFKRKEEAFVYKERMMAVADRIMRNLTAPRNVSINRKNATEGVLYYHKIDEK